MASGKDLAKMLVSKMPPPDVDVEVVEDSPMGDVDEGEQAAAESIMMAIQAGDPVALVQSIKDLLEMLR